MNIQELFIQYRIFIHFTWMNFSLQRVEVHMKKMKIGSMTRYNR